MKRSRIGSGAIILLVWLSSVIACNTQIDKKILPEGTDLWPMEKAVLKEVLSCKTADLKELAGDGKENNRIRGNFLVLLLNNKLKGIKVPSSGVKIKNATIINEMILTDADIPFDVIISDCKFKEKVLIKDCHFKGNLQIRGEKSCFEKDVEFIRMKVDHNVYFNDTRYQGKVSFYAVEISKEFSVVKCYFETGGDFTELEVGRNAYLNEAKFNGSFDFSKTKIGRDLKANAIKLICKDQNNVANFNDVIVKGSILFPEAIFEGNVSFEWARMKHLELTHGAKAKDIILHGALIEDVLTIKEAEINNLQAQRINVKMAELHNVTVNDKLDFTGTQIERKLDMSDLRLKSLVACHLRVKGPATFEHIKIEKEADFQNANIETLEFKQVTWPCEPAKRKLDGLTYTSIYIDKPNSFKGALDLVERSAFNPQNYMQLEDFCKRRGRPDWADKVSIAMKDRELDKGPWYAWWLKKVFWGWPAGYGRKPIRILVASLIIIFAGAVLFNPKYLEKEKNPVKSTLPSNPEYFEENEKPTRGGALQRGLLRFLISLDQFLPAVNLGLADNWNAKDTHFFIWLFFTLEQGFGWIFVSIGLAAIYSQIQ